MTTLRRPPTARILVGDCRDVLQTLPDRSVQTVTTSPPYFGLRSYTDDEELKTQEVGTEPTPDEFVQALVAVFREVRRVLRDDGTVWLNLGDSYTWARGRIAATRRG
jgi:DNA modification methylase